MRWTMSPVLRMAFFAPDLILATGGDASVVRLNRFIGWNGDGQAPWPTRAGRSTSSAMPIPGCRSSSSGLLGGQVVLHLADEPDVVAVAALGPLDRDRRPVVGHPGERFLLVHGRKDRITDPRQTNGMPPSSLTAEPTSTSGWCATCTPCPAAGTLAPGRRAIRGGRDQDANSADRPN